MVISSAKTVEVLTAVHRNIMVLRDMTVDGVGTNFAEGCWFLYPMLHRLASQMTIHTQCDTSLSIILSCKLIVLCMCVQ
jgi:hypothetical protein